MSKIVIIGAGAMGSAFSFPCIDNNHDTTIVGTHLENEFIENLRKNKNLHPTLNVLLPEKVNIFKFDSVLKDSDFQSLKEDIFQKLMSGVCFTLISKHLNPDSGSQNRVVRQI